MQVSVKTKEVLLEKKNKQFIKLCHQYIHNINENILQIYINFTVHISLPKGIILTTDGAVI